MSNLDNLSIDLKIDDENDCLVVTLMEHDSQGTIMLGSSYLPLRALATALGLPE